MSLHTMTAEQKLQVLQEMIRLAKKSGDDAQALKAIAADYEAKAHINRGRALSELTRALEKLARSKTDLGYSHTLLIDVANKLIRYWPTVQHALELFGEETAE